MQMICNTFCSETQNWPFSLPQTGFGQRLKKKGWLDAIMMHPPTDRLTMTRLRLSKDFEFVCSCNFTLVGNDS